MTDALEMWVVYDRTLLGHLFGIRRHATGQRCNVAHLAAMARADLDLIDGDCRHRGIDVAHSSVL
jgi:hypothetical protein